MTTLLEDYLSAIKTAKLVMTTIEAKKKREFLALRIAELHRQTINTLKIKCTIGSIFLTAIYSYDFMTLSIKYQIEVIIKVAKILDCFDKKEIGIITKIYSELIELYINKLK